MTTRSFENAKPFKSRDLLGYETDAGKNSLDHAPLTYFPIAIVSLLWSLHSPFYMQNAL